MSVVGPGVGHGRYRVHVQWVPRRAGLFDRLRTWRHGDSGPGFRAALVHALGMPLSVAGEGGALASLVVGAVAVVGLAVAFLLAWWILIPLLLLVADGLVVVSVVAAGVLVRVLFHRPWVVVVQEGEQVVARAEAVGWRHARQARERIAASLARGMTPQQAVLG
jgi:hypothetical protein